MRFIMIFSGRFEFPGSARRRAGTGTRADDGVVRYWGFKGFKNCIANALNMKYVN